MDYLFFVEASLSAMARAVWDLKLPVPRLHVAVGGTNYWVLFLGGPSPCCIFFKVCTGGTGLVPFAHPKNISIEKQYIYISIYFNRPKGGRISAQDDELHVLVDGCHRPPELLAEGEKWTRQSSKDLEAARNQQKISHFFACPRLAPAKSCPKKVEAVVEGDGRVPSISAASILAKVHRDHLMMALDEEYPGYGFKTHKALDTYEGINKFCW